jgi:hypothetical protein
MYAHLKKSFSWFHLTISRLIHAYKKPTSDNRSRWSTVPETNRTEKSAHFTSSMHMRSSHYARTQSNENVTRPLLYGTGHIRWGNRNTDTVPFEHFVKHLSLNANNSVYLPTISHQAKYITFFVSACTVMARAMAPGVRSSLHPDWWEPSPLKSDYFCTKVTRQRTGLEVDKREERTGQQTLS